MNESHSRALALAQAGQDIAAANEAIDHLLTLIRASDADCIEVQVASMLMFFSGVVVDLEAVELVLAVALDRLAHCEEVR